MDQNRKSDENNRKVHINFQRFANIKDAVDVYTCLKRKQRKKSEYIATAYQIYKETKNTPFFASEIINNLRLMSYIIQKYDLAPNDSKKVRTLLESIDRESETAKDKKTENTSLGSINLVFSDTDKRHLEVLRELKSFDNMRDRTLAVINYVKAYWASGEDEEYLKNQSGELLRGMAALYKEAKTDEMLDQIVRTLSTPYKAEFLPSYVKEERN